MASAATVARPVAVIHELSHPTRMSPSARRADRTGWRVDPFQDPEPLIDLLCEESTTRRPVPGSPGWSNRPRPLASRDRRETSPPGPPAQAGSIHSVPSLARRRDVGARGEYARRSRRSATRNSTSSQTKEGQQVGKIDEALGLLPFCLGEVDAWSCRSIALAPLVHPVWRRLPRSLGRSISMITFRTISPHRRQSITTRSEAMIACFPSPLGDEPRTPLRQAPVLWSRRASFAPALVCACGVPRGSTMRRLRGDLISAPVSRRT